MQVSHMCGAFYLCVSDMNRDTLTWRERGGLRHKSRHKSTEMPRVSSLHRALHDEGRRFRASSRLSSRLGCDKRRRRFLLFGTKKNGRKKLEKHNHEPRVPWQIRKFPPDRSPTIGQRQTLKCELNRKNLKFKCNGLITQVTEQRSCRGEGKAHI
jgi:hypothetical protein